MHHQTFQKTLARWSLIAISAAAILRLLYAAWIDSMDFNVYWNAAQVWVHGTASPYYFDAATRGFVFKYPPWILPLFTPFGFLPAHPSRLLWAFVELACLAYACRWLLLAGVQKRLLIATLFLFWWIWLAHFFAGQFTLVLLAAALWAVSSSNAASDETRPFRTAAASVVFVAKVFSIVTLWGVWRRFLSPRVLAWSAVLAIVPSLAVWGLMKAHGSDETFLGLFAAWAKAATSGGAELGAIVIRGQMNHGFTAGVLRWLGVSHTETRADLFVAAALALVLGSGWMRASRAIPKPDQWAGWIGVGLICHPLAWHHSFVLAFPLCALALSRAWQQKDRKLIAVALGGIACIGILIPNVIGETWVRPLELVSIKSWGVCLSAWVLVRANAGPAAQASAVPLS